MHPRARLQPLRRSSGSRGYRDAHREHHCHIDHCQQPSAAPPNSRRDAAIGGSAVAMASLLLFGFPIRRRRTMTQFGRLLIAILIGATIGCGGKKRRSPTPGQSRHHAGRLYCHSHGFQWFDHGHHRRYSDRELSVLLRGVAVTAESLLADFDHQFQCSDSSPNGPVWTQPLHGSFDGRCFDVYA